MPGPRRTKGQIPNPHYHRQSQESESHEPRRQSPRTVRPSLRAREIMEVLTEEEGLPVQPGEKKRSRMFELRTTEESNAGSLSREEKKRKITRRSAYGQSDPRMIESTQPRVTDTSVTTNTTIPTMSTTTRKKSYTKPSEPQPAQIFHPEIPSTDDTVEGVQYASDEEEHGQMTAPHATSENTDNNDVICISDAPLPEYEEGEEEEEEIYRGGGSRFEDPRAPQDKDLEPEEAEAFQPDKDTRVNEFENRLAYLRKTGGSNRARVDIEEEQEALGIQAKDGRFKDITLDELESGQPIRTPGVQKKRRYERISFADMANDMEPRIKRLEELTRITFLSTLDPDICQALVDRVFPEYTDSASEAWVGRAASRRVRQNTAQWKSRTIKAMRVWVEKVFKMDAAGRELRDHIFNVVALRHMFDARYTIDEFEHVFSFTRHFVNLRKSSPRARWWAQQIFLNIAAYTKCVLDVESGRSPATNIADLRLLSQAGLCKTFNDIGKKEGLRKYRPALSEFFFDNDAASKRRKSADANKLHDVNEDNLVSMTCLPPGVDQDSVDPHIAIDDYTQSHRGGEKSIIFKKKTNRVH